ERVQQNGLMKIGDNASARRPVFNLHTQLEQILTETRSRENGTSCDRLLLSHNLHCHAIMFTLFNHSCSKKRNLYITRLCHQFPQRNICQCNLPLRALFPAIRRKGDRTLIRASRIIYRRACVLRRHSFAHEQMQEAHTDIKEGISVILSHHQAFCLHHPGFYTAVCLAILAWIYHTDSPALPVFDRGMPVWVEQIPLVENRVSNLFYLLH